MGVTRWTYLGLTLLVVGLLTAGAGGATHLHERQCQAVQFISVAETNDTDSDAVAYGTLSAPEKRVFDEALASGGQVLTQRGVLDSMVVTRGDQRYLVRTTSANGTCSPWHPNRVVTPIVGGVTLVLLGGALTRGRYPDE